MQGMMSFVRVLPPDEYDKVMEQIRQGQPADENARHAPFDVRRGGPMQIKITMLTFLPVRSRIRATAHQHRPGAPADAARTVSDNSRSPRIRPCPKRMHLSGNRAHKLVRRGSIRIHPSGYQGEQIRGGAYGGGEQGAFAQQTFVLGGKLGLRRNVFEQQRRADEIDLRSNGYRVLAGVGQSFYSALAAQEVVHVRERITDACPGCCYHRASTR